MKVLQVSAEIYPLLKTGGLADIAGALPAALTAAGCDLRLLLPGFAPILENLQGASVCGQRVTPWGETVTLRQGRLAALDMQAYVIDAPGLYARPGGPYEDVHRQPFADNHRRFALLGWMAGELAQGMDANWQPEVVHSHDWHAGLAPAYLAFPRVRQPRPVASLHTVHNLAYQGVFSQHCFADLGLPQSAFSVDGVEYYGQVSFMKAGLYYANRITTVSPSYAKEIQTPEQGCGLDGLLRARGSVLTGILNGVDEAVWNPATDTLIHSTYGASDRAGKNQCKAALQAELGLAVHARAPVFAVVSRLTEQKGLQLVLSAIDEMIARGGQLVVLGSGDSGLENALAERARRQPQSVAAFLGYDEALAHRIFAGSDVTLVPSRFEPCGLTQMYGLKYGSLPLVHRVGGLADTVVDCVPENLAAQSANGITFDDFSAEAFADAMRRALALYESRADWDAVTARGMQQSLGWQNSAAQYVALYRQIA